MKPASIFAFAVNLADLGLHILLVMVCSSSPLRELPRFGEHSLLHG